MKKISEHPEKSAGFLGNKKSTKQISKFVRKRSFQTRGEISLKIVFSILISLVVLIVIFLSFGSVQEVIERKATAEIINLKASIETRILQQSVRPRGSIVNVSFSVPSSISKVCFFDANKEHKGFRNPELTSIYEGDQINNLFFMTDSGFFHYHIDGLEIQEERNPLCVNMADNRIELKLVSTGDGTDVEASEAGEDVKCVSVLENGNPAKKIDFVFLGYGFEDIEEYNNQVNRYINNIILEFEPFKYYKDKFNFYRIDDAKVDCKISGFIQCDQFDILKAASDCPNDYIFLLVDRSVIKDMISPVRSSAIGKIAKINTADKPFVLVHELGHTFADLADEYVDEGYYSTSNFDAASYINCDSAPCSSWQNIGNTSCYEGCSLKRYFRPTKDSIMRSLSSPGYGPVNEREILKRLLYYE